MPTPSSARPRGTISVSEATRRLGVTRDAVVKFGLTGQLRFVNVIGNPPLVCESSLNDLAAEMGRPAESRAPAGA